MPVADGPPGAAVHPASHTNAAAATVS